MTVGDSAPHSDSDDAAGDRVPESDSDDNVEVEPQSEEGGSRTYTTEPIQWTGDTLQVVFGISNEESFGFSVTAATPLAEGVPVGDAAESAVLDVAANFGHHDAVFESRQDVKGSGTRERGGDGIILCGKRGLIVSSKSRRTAGAPNAEAEPGRIQARIDEAYHQASGSYNALMRDGSLTLVNRRGRSIPIDGQSVDWTIVVVVELEEGHPSFVPSVPNIPSVPIIDGKPSAVVLTRRDWDFLYRHLRSNYAVVDYLHRVRGDQRALGEEAWRYGEYAVRDAGPGLPHTATQASSAPAALSPAARVLPGSPVDQADLEEHLTLRFIMEQVATAETRPNDPETERLRMLNVLDSFPVTRRTELGRTLRAELGAAQRRDEDRPEVTCYIYVGSVDDLPVSIYFGVAGGRSESVADHHTVVVNQLYAKLCEMTGRTDCVAVALMLYPLADDPTWDWDMSVKMRHG